MEKHSTKNTAIEAQKPSARANIVVLLFLIYWLSVPYAVYAVMDTLGIESLSVLAHSIMMFTIQFIDISMCDEVTVLSRNLSNSHTFNQFIK